MGLFRITWDYSGQLRTNQNHMRTIGTIYINSGLKETKLKGDQSGTNRTNWNHYTHLKAYRIFETIQDQTEPTR